VSEELDIPELRKDRDKAWAKVKQLEEQLVTESGRVRLFEAREAFAEAGLKSKHADLFVATHPDAELDKEVIMKFADEYGLVPEPTPAPSGEGEEKKGETKGSKDLSLMSRSGSRAGEGGSAGIQPPPMTREEWEALLISDRSAAEKALHEGRVQIRKDNFYAQHNRR
jgi:hypothetical protein